MSSYDGIGPGSIGARLVISNAGLAHQGSILSDLLPFLLNNNITNNTNTTNQHNNYNNNNNNNNNKNNSNNNKLAEFWAQWQVPILVPDRV